ncbi:MAG: glyoxylate/hydroxypyruvate reductase A, partial [Proteobacteria bacterium]|nr:glyoxylate/hydroxypyruvate reductase A [Pseudomonadota bacterium]
ESILWAHPNVYITPHIASITHPPTACRYIADAISRHRQGEPWPHLVETGRGY